MGPTSLGGVSWAMEGWVDSYVELEKNGQAYVTNGTDISAACRPHVIWQTWPRVVV